MEQTVENKKIDEEVIIEEHGKKKKSKTILWVILTVFILLGGVIALIRLDVGGMTEKYLRNRLQTVPIVRNVLPPVKEKATDPYADFSEDQLKSKIAELQKKSEEKDELLAAVNTQNEQLQKEILRLKQIEAQQLKFKEEKEKFDLMIAEKDTKGFAEFYKQINSETAEEIYKQVITQEKTSKDQKKYTETFQTMDAANAADVLEEMVATDMDLVVLILNNIESEQRGAILGEMDPKIAANVTKRMAPQ